MHILEHLERFKFTAGENPCALMMSEKFCDFWEVKMKCKALEKPTMFGRCFQKKASNFAYLKLQSDNKNDLKSWKVCKTQHKVAVV